MAVNSSEELLAYINQHEERDKALFSAVLECFKVHRENTQTDLSVLKQNLKVSK